MTQTEAPVPAPPRVRLVAALVQLELVVDDGDTLHPLRVEPLRLAAADAAGWDPAATIAEAQRQIDARGADA